MALHILWAVVVGFLVGVFARSFIPLGPAFAAFLGLLAVTTLVLAWLDRAKLRTLLVIAVVLFACAGGILRMNAATLTGDPALTELIGTNVTLSGVVADEPDARESGVRVFLRTDRVGSSTPVSAGLPRLTRVKAGVLVSLPRHSDVTYGDHIVVKGRLGLPEKFDSDLGRQFDYPAFLAKDGIGYELSFVELESTGENTGNPLKALAVKTKQIYVHGIDAALGEPEAGLAAGITVGDKRGMGKELSETFRTVGLVHVVVLSGYNITLVINFVRILLQRLPRALEYGGIVGAVLFFVVMSGSSATAIRAAAMALIAILARSTGRMYDAIRILGVVAAAMVLWNPFILAFDPGFQLSALATLGLVLFTPMFLPYFEWLTERFALREIAASTLGTQLAVLPLLLYQNGQLSLVALPVNLLALIAVPWAMFASFIAALAGSFLGALAVPIAYPAYILLAYIIGVAKMFAALPFAALSISAFSAWWMFAAYALMFGGLWFIQKRTAVRTNA
ncbi:MAG: ComEC/Rec2 family competence protein [Patescibacteria group bacterium]